MIVSHKLKLIFVKTKKTGGTSFEIALSKFGGPLDIITPIRPEDEALRTALGFRGPQRFRRLRADASGGRRPRAVFQQHLTADQIRARLPAGVWARYRKITIMRDPFDAIISRYHWDGGEEIGLSIEDWVRANPGLLTENRAIAPLSGPSALDHYIRYEHLNADLAAIGLGEVAATMQGIRAKGEFRPRTTATVAEVYAAYPGLATLVETACATEIARFGYRVPGR